MSEDHFIVAVRVTQNATDNASLLPMLAEVERQCRAQPEKVLADSGFYSGQNLDALQARGMDGYIPDSNLARELNTGKAAGGKPRVRHRETRRMRQKLRRPAGRKIYQQRKAIVEPANQEALTQSILAPHNPLPRSGFLSNAPSLTTTPRRAPICARKLFEWMLNSGQKPRPATLQLRCR